MLFKVEQFLGDDYIEYWIYRGSYTRSQASTISISKMEKLRSMHLSQV
ncbi:MAG: hypothetical protein JWN30_1830 [Bacilli bacterium]|nr:hypothetical protein [Bacilli bacterium]